MKKISYLLIIVFILSCSSETPTNNSEPENYSLNILTQGAGSVLIDTLQGQNIYPTVELTAKPYDGWRFSKWQEDISTNENPTSVTMDEDLNIEAKFNHNFKVFGGTGFDTPTSLINTKDGGYAITGFTPSEDGDFNQLAGKSDVFVMKLNSSGETEWIKTFGGSEEDRSFSITQTQDEGYSITGYTESSDGDFEEAHNDSKDMFVVKLTSSGATDWIKTLGGSDNDESFSITNANDGGVVLTGWSYSNDGDFTGMQIGSHDVYVIKLNNSGEIDWIKNFGGDRNDMGTSIIRTEDNGYAVAGWNLSGDGDFSESNDDDGDDIFVIKLNSLGESEWISTFAGDISKTTDNFIQTTDNGYAIAGYTINNGSYETYFIKLTESGQLQWDKILGGSERDTFSSIIQTEDNNYLIGGGTESTDGDFSDREDNSTETFAMELNTSGDIEWVKYFDETGANYSSTLTTNNEYIFTGTFLSNEGMYEGLSIGSADIYLIKFNSDGTITPFK